MTRDATILRLLRTASLHLLPSQLAAEARISLGELEQGMAALLEAGFEIERRPGLGYKLLASPDRLMADDLWSRFTEETSPLVREIIVLAETGSTNDVAAQLGREGAAGGVVVLAERQTAGRGRFGRRWESAVQRGLWLSLLLRPRLPLAEWARLTTWAAVGLCASLERVARCPARIKWPNDVEMAGRKVAGILAEVGLDARGERFLVLGLGINVNHEAGDFPPELAERAGSLRLAAGRMVDRAELAVELLQELAGSESLLATSFARIVAAASHRSTLLGQAIEARAGAVVQRGLAEELDEDGHLLLRTAEGELVKLTAGEITLRTGP